MVELDFKISFNVEDCLKKLGLEERGRVQQAVAAEFLKNVNPYVPFDAAGKYENPGQLRDSGHLENENTEAVWRTPYARNLYYHPEYTFQGAPLAGGYWADRYIHEGGLKELEALARKKAAE